MRALLFLLLTTMVTLTVLPGVAKAQDPTLLGTHGDWEAYRFEANGQVTCYILSKPTKLLPTNRNHGDVFFFLTARPAENVTNEPSVLVGYPFKPDSQVTVDVDGKKFSLFTKEDGAWVESSADEQQLVAAMRAGRRMTVSGTSARGTNTEYEFSLSGVTAGSNRLTGGCNS